MSSLQTLLACAVEEIRKDLCTVKDGMSTNGRVIRKSSMSVPNAGNLSVGTNDDNVENGYCGDFIVCHGSDKHNDCIDKSSQCDSPNHVHCGIKGVNCGNSPGPIKGVQTSPPASQSQLSIVSWNCRGLQYAEPYLQSLAKCNDIVIVCEHWLWPYELSRLPHLLDGFSSVSCSDKRLDENSSLKRGCGGVAIFWMKAIKAISVPTSSDRLLAIQLPMAEFTALSIVGVYLPSTDQPLPNFIEYLQELESIVSTLQAQGPVVVMGDFNAHIGALAGGHLKDPPNAQGRLLYELMASLDLYAVSLSEVAQGPNFTFSNGVHETTVDYSFIDSYMTSNVTKCSILPKNPLNLSDHLPVTLSLGLTPVGSQSGNAGVPRVNWNRAIKDGSIETYAESVNVYISTILHHPLPENSDNLENELSEVCNKLMSISAEILPHMDHKANTANKKKKKFYKDEVLKKLCKEKKDEWYKWKTNGKPRSGQSFDALKSAKNRIKSYIRKCEAREDRERIQRRDRMVKESHHERFYVPRKKPICSTKALCKWECLL